MNIHLENSHGICESLSNMIDTPRTSVADFRDFLEDTPVEDIEKNWYKAGSYRRLIEVKQRGDRVRLTLKDYIGNISYLSYDKPQQKTEDSKLTYIRERLVDILEHNKGKTPVSELVKLIEYIDS